MVSWSSQHVPQIPLKSPTDPLPVKERRSLKSINAYEKINNKSDGISLADDPRNKKILTNCSLQDHIRYRDSVAEIL